jgi:pyrroline-5-carboxylate reductase
LVWDKVPSAMQRVSDMESVVSVGSLEQLVAEAQFVILVVKPRDAEEVLSSLAPLFSEEQVVISAMAGVELARLRLMAGPRPALFRVMPNLGVEVGAGTVAIAAEPGGAPGLQERVTALFAALGLATVVPESMMDAVTAVSGTGPALLALAAEGLEDGGVAAGLPRSFARTFVRSAMLGAARILVAGDEPAGELQRRLAPPGDPLREGMEILEERRVKRAFEDAVQAASRRARQMRAPTGPPA